MLELGLKPSESTVSSHMSRDRDAHHVLSATGVWGSALHATRALEGAGILSDPQECRCSYPRLMHKETSPERITSSPMVTQLQVAHPRTSFPTPLPRPVPLQFG